MQSANLGILVRELLGSEIPDRAEEIRDILKAAGWKGTGAARLVAALWKKAVGGDVNAAKLIREMNGETEGGIPPLGNTLTDGTYIGTGSAGTTGFNITEMSDEALRAILDSADTITEETAYKTADTIRQDRTADEAADFAGTSVSDSAGTSADDSAGESASVSAGTSVDDSAGKSVPASASAETRVNAASAEMDEKKKKSTYVVPW